MRPTVLAALLAACCAVPAADWGVDGNGGGAGLIRLGRPEILKVVRVPEAERPAAARALVERRARELVEVLKRFRNPELKAVALEMMRSADWQIAYRGLLAAEMFDDPSLLPEAWRLMSDQRARMREKAAITCIKLWNAEAGRKVAGGDAALMLGGMIEREKVPHVKQCLQALRAAMGGKLNPTWVSPEFLVTGDDELRMAPYVDAFEKVGELAPGWRRDREPQRSEHGAGSLPAASRWATPLLDWATEEVLAAGLQTFGVQGQVGGPIHAGLDVGGCLDGAGVYAVTDGIVRLIRTGGPEGTAIAVEHNLGKGELATSLYLHCGDAVFVAAGDKVTAGQLLTTVGMGFSTTNGGVPAHLHFGLHPGAFDEARVAESVREMEALTAWFDPRPWLEERLEGARPLVEVPAKLDPSFAKVKELLEKGEPGKACVEAMKLMAAKGATDAQKESGQAVADAVAKGTREVMGRAQRKRESGFPSDALDLLKTWAPKFRGSPAGGDMEMTIQTWGRDEAFRREAAGEKEILAAELRVKDLKEKGASKDEVRAVWDGLLKKYGDTNLKMRIQRRLDLLK